MTQTRLVLTDTGSVKSPGTLQWLTLKLRPRDTITTTNVHTHFNDLPYQIISSDGSVEGERRGIVTLIHNRWRHRRVGKVIHDTHKRWLALDIRTPLGRTTIIAAYLHETLPRFQHSHSQRVGRAVGLYCTTTNSKEEKGDPSR